MTYLVRLEQEARRFVARPVPPVSNGGQFLYQFMVSLRPRVPAGSLRAGSRTIADEANPPMWCDTH
jgi:hypothetical protein